MRRIMVAVWLSGLSALPVAAQPVAERLPICLACHGEKGTSETPDTPSLGGQTEFYSTVQLLMFREKMRTVEPMNEMAKGLTDGDLQSLATFIAKLPPMQAPADAGDPGRIARAKELSAQHKCNVCHKPDFSGQDNVPRIGGQREDYLVKALRGYKDNSRRGYDASMADVIQPVTDANILDLAHYIARVK